MSLSLLSPRYYIIALADFWIRKLAVFKHSNETQTRRSRYAWALVISWSAVCQYLLPDWLLSHAFFIYSLPAGIMAINH